MPVLVVGRWDAPASVATSGAFSSALHSKLRRERRLGLQEELNTPRECVAWTTPIRQPRKADAWMQLIFAALIS